MTYDLRMTIYQALNDDPQLTELVGDRVMARTGLEEKGQQVEKPFVVYFFGYTSRLGPTAVGGKGQWVHVWAHQARGDYFLVDQILDHCQRVLEALPNEGSFYEIRHLERSEDLEDDMMETNCRFDRYQATIL
jgi:hypothetical protein